LSRYPDHPATQAAKGHPGKRRTRVERQLEEADRVAGMLAAAPPDPNQPLAPPAFLDARFAPALAVWNEYAPQLSRLNLLDTLDRLPFATFCVYMGEFVTANEAIARDGYSIKVKTVSGGMMPRKNPNVDRRDIAMDYILDFAERFGLTPLDRAKLFRDHAALPPEAAASLFHHKPLGPKAPEEAATSAQPEAVGSMDAFDSAPPGHLPN
jgi:P27 family predicted phage terminase small subunit